MNVDTSTNNEDLCFVDNAPTHTILNSNNNFFLLFGYARSQYYHYLWYYKYIWRLQKSYDTSTKNLNGNLLSFKDICLNGYHIETNNE